MNINKLTTRNTTIQHCGIIGKLIEDCYEEKDMDKKLHLLHEINSLIPKSWCINIPSLITNDYIDTALYRIEENVRGIVVSV